MAFMYCKLFASLYQGTLRGLPHPILVFTNLLAHCDKDGFVDKHFRAIADEVGLTVEEVKAAIAFLESPDEESRSKEAGGRRLLRINDDRAWGWQVVNYAKYRAIRTEEDRREQNRLAQKRFRDKQKSADVSDRKQTVSNSKPSVSSRQQPSSASAHVEGDGDEDGEVHAKEEEKEKKKKTNSASRCTREELDSFCRENDLFPRDSEYLWNHWESNGWTNGGRPIKDWKATVRKWKTMKYLPTTQDKTVEDFWPDDELQITFYPPSPPFELPEGMRPDGSLIPEVMFRKIREQREREEQGLD